jgi:ABC-type transporter Mla subunit MlaD
MALHDLTPQLRTRLSRMERAVGWFVFIALLALLFGFGYYLYNTAQRKGWFKLKAPYFTFTDRATGLAVGDPVQLMGFNVGRITWIDTQPPEDPYNVYVEFEVQSPYYGYIWTEGSIAKVATADFLGKRVLELTKGTNGYPAYIFNQVRQIAIDDVPTLPETEKWAYGEEILNPTTMTPMIRPNQPLTNLNEVAAMGITNIVVLDLREKGKAITGVWNDRLSRYEPYIKGKTKPYWLVSDESPPVTDILEAITAQVQSALPGIFSLTNQLRPLLSNSATLAATLNEVALSAKPAVSNIATATAQLDRPGALGEWLLPTNLNSKLDLTLGNAATTMDTANTNLAALAGELIKSLENLASISSNLNQQVEANTNIVSAISKTITDTDDLIQGLKRHWLLRSAFKTAPDKSKESRDSSAPQEVLRSPKQEGR